MYTARLPAERMRLDVSHAIEFIETPTFTRQIQAIATDDELKEL